VGKKILIVDDEKSIVDILKFNLEKEGFQTLEAYDGEQAMDLAISANPDIILLDVMLPKVDGFTVCRKLRQYLSVPIIMLTAKEEEVDKVLGLELGADDYITKPFSIREVIARLKANLRRTYNGEVENMVGNTFKCGCVEIDRDKYEIKRDGTIIELTLREFELVKFLALHHGQIFSRESLLKKYGDMSIMVMYVQLMLQ